MLVSDIDSMLYSLNSIFSSRRAARLKPRSDSDFRLQSPRTLLLFAESITPQ
jgi:hypothetical protein